MKIVISHPHGNPNTSKVVTILFKYRLLDVFWTTIAFPLKFGPFKKKYFKISYNKIKLRILKEAFRKFCVLFNLKKFYLYEKSTFSVYSIYKDLDFTVSKYLKNNIKKINIIYSYEDCSINSFKIAKENNIKTIYDLTSPYWRLKKKILDEEKLYQPNWNLSSLEFSSDNKCRLKDDELFLSDEVIVASKFSADSLKLYKKKKIIVNVIPYGVKCPEKKFINRREKNTKFKILFVGRPILSKGIQYLIKIVSLLDFNWEIEIAGSIPEKPFQISKSLDIFFKSPKVKFLGQINHSKLLNKMQKSHVLLLPSLYEGFGHVLLEALSCGLPIITTENTGGRDFVKDSINGFITPIRDTSKTVETLYKLYEDEQFRRFISENSYSTASDMNWEKYEENLEKILKK